MSWMAWVVGPIWVFAGIAVFQFYSKHRAVPTEDEIHVVEEEPAPAGDEYRVMVGVANPQTALPLVRTTYKLCGAKEGRIELLHMVPAPEQVPLSDVPRYTGEGREGIVEMMIYLTSMFPVSTTMRYCRSIARGIISAVREKRTDLLILGWRGQPQAGHFALGSTLDPVIERVPCNVIILKNFEDRPFHRVLVPVTGGPNGAFALEVGSILVQEKTDELTILTVDTGRKAFDVKQFVEEHKERIRLPLDRVTTKVVKSQDVVGAILDESTTYDLVVIGCTAESWLYRLTHETIPAAVAKACPTPIAMVKARTGIRSWMKRWF